MGRERTLVCAVAGWGVAAALFLFIVADFNFDAPPSPPLGQLPSSPAPPTFSTPPPSTPARTPLPEPEPVLPSVSHSVAGADQGGQPAGDADKADKQVSLPPQLSVDAEMDTWEGTSAPPPTTEECQNHVAGFMQAHEKLKAAVDLTAEPKFLLKGHWADGDAFCGPHLLYEKTAGQVLLMVTGGALKEGGRTSEVSTVSVYNCLGGCADVDLRARLVGPTIVGADVVRMEGGRCGWDVHFTAYEPGAYSLEVKHVHLNGSSFNWKEPVALGVDRSRVRGPNGEKLFARHSQCARQRNVWGGPFSLQIRGDPLVPAAARTPRCYTGEAGWGETHRGRWVAYNSQTCTGPQPYCAGNPWWLADAYGYNRELLWAPARCHYRIYSPPAGPMKPCLERRGVLGIIGDSIAREYVQNCKLFRLMDAGLACEHWHMIINGEYFSPSYAHDVTKVIIDKLHSDKPVAIAANFGLMHMIGMRNDSDWEYYMRHFSEEWKKRPPVFSLRKIWLGAPTIHYATRGMTQQRVSRWEGISLKYLKPLGFEQLYAHPVTRMREEGSWDGLHNSAEKGHKQSKVRNRRVKEFKWNGGISHMLWNVLLNMLCPQG
eukprot:Hpha_TRINITY_DN3021_c0_g1::TRINITY_DN3021_c0_g1_i1::g.138523::m.138523